jgi:hypothetical protein
MFMRIQTFGLLLLATALCTVSCKKGDTGPAGAAGPAGAQGPAGSPNVIYSSWFTPDTYIKDTVFGIWGFYYDKATTDITQKTADSGVVIVYAKLLGYNPLVWPVTQVGQLPITLTYVQGTTMSDTWSGRATAGNLRIRFFNDHNYYTSISNAHQFRYIVIPGGVKSTVASAKPGLKTGRGSQAEVEAVAANYKQMSYEEVCQRLNIPVE